MNIKKNFYLLIFLTFFAFLLNSYSLAEITFEKKKLDLNFKCFKDGKYSKQFGFQKFTWLSNQTEYFLAAQFIDDKKYYGLPISSVFQYENQTLNGKNYPNIYVFYNTVENFEWENKKHNVLIKKFLYQINDKDFILKEVLISISDDYETLKTIQDLMDKEYDDQKYMTYLIPLTQMFLDAENSNKEQRLFTFSNECEIIQ